MNEKQVLVTGGAGYIGSHTVVELQNNGYEVIIIDDLSNSEIGVIGNIFKITGKRPEFVQLDLTDITAVRRFAESRQDISKIIHFAAYKSVAESVREPLKYYRNNLYSLINVLDAFKQRKLDFVFSSSCTVYGEPDSLPVTEEAPMKKAESPYGNTKQIAEELLAEFAASANGFRCVALRYFNPVGAHQSALIGELPLGVPQNLVPYVTQSAIGKRGPITVFGANYNTPDGSCIRDFIHVVDLARAHVAALHQMENNSANNYEAINIGTGNGYSVLELLNEFEVATGVKLNYHIGERRDGDIVKIWGDVFKAKHILNWRAKFDLTEMLKSAWAWENQLARRNKLAN